MRAARLLDALERLTAAIRDVESELAAMKAEHDPVALHIFVSRCHYRNVSDTKSGKRRAMITRVSSILPVSVDFAAASTSGTASWEQLQGGERLQHAYAFSGNTGSTPGASKTFQPQWYGLLADFSCLP